MIGCRRVRRAGRAWTAAALPAAAVAATLLLGAGCSLRDRSNPLDPKNRTTGGQLTGFNALAGDRVVLLRWTQLAQTGVESWRVDRWTPGAAPEPFGLFGAQATSAEDVTVHNDSTYVYRLVARFVSGDSASSPADTVTPGTRRTMVIVADPPAAVGLSPDARDILFVDESSEAFGDIDLDSTRGVFWLSQVERGLITSRTFEQVLGIEFDAPHPSDLAVTPQRGGVVWAAQPELSRISRFGTVDTLAAAILGVGPARAVEADGERSMLWIGSDDGRLFHASTATLDTVQTWRFAGRVNPVAVDESADAAWAAVRVGELVDLYRVIAGDPTPALVRSGLVNVTDLEVEPATHTVWVCERGVPLAGSGRLTRVDASGQVLALVTGLEPYAVSVEPGSSACWVADLRSGRVLEISPDGVILRRSPPLGVPYGLRVYRP